jgi:hypothetical protein
MYKEQSEDFLNNHQKSILEVKILKENIGKIPSDKINSFRQNTRNKVHEFLHLLKIEKDSQQVMELSGKDDFLARSIKTQIVEHKLIYNSDADQEKIIEMARIARQERSLAEMVKKEFEDSHENQEIQNLKDNREFFNKFVQSVINFASSKYRYGITKDSAFQDFASNLEVIKRARQMSIIKDTMDEALKHLNKMQEELNFDQQRHMDFKKNNQMVN